MKKYSFGLLGGVIIAAIAFYCLGHRHKEAVPSQEAEPQVSAALSSQVIEVDESIQHLSHKLHSMEYDYSESKKLIERVKGFNSENNE
ncbi:hypothetical protein [Agarivorans sp. QJM3NY_25]|uniref:hypothetical protein n=1 Tax=Agarivorans sp. QJM3NY_25 TaxID=3421430 RepID=UPI003D7ED867